MDNIGVECRNSKIDGVRKNINAYLSSEVEIGSEVKPCSMRVFNIAIIGSGVVGYATGKALSTIGNSVTFFDVSQDALNRIEGEGYKVARTLSDVKDVDIFFVIVPTPDKDEQIDLSCVKCAITDLSEMLKNRNSYFTIIIKSTVIPLTTERLIIPMIERITEKICGRDFGVCFNPEFLNESHPYEDVINPDRIVIGEYDKMSGDTLASLYSVFSCPIIRTSIVTAEMSKYANNTFNATKISFFNEIIRMCEKINADAAAIHQIVKLDRNYGIHPWHIGTPYGGKCLPKDTNAIIHMFNHGGLHEPVLLKAVKKINDELMINNGNNNGNMKNELVISNAKN